MTRGVAPLVSGYVWLIPGDTGLHDRSVGRGYATLKETDAATSSNSPAPDTLLYAHEFHHASLEILPGDLD